MINKNATRIGVYGGSGSGKSTKAKLLMKEMGLGVIAFDPLDEYAEEGFTRFDNLKTMAKYLKRMYGKPFKYALVPDAGKEAEQLHALSVFLVAVQANYKAGKCTTQLLLLVEEMNLSYPVEKLSKGLNGFSNICSRGRHFGINVMGISQRPAEINTRFRGNCNGFYVFRMAEHNDLTALAKVMGPEVKETIRNLKTHEYIYWENGEIKRGKNVLK